MSHLNTAYQLGIHVAESDFNKEAAGLTLPGSLRTKMLAGGAVGAAGGEDHRVRGALIGAGLGAGAGAGAHALDARALKGRVAAATEAREAREAERYAAKKMREAAESAESAAMRGKSSAFVKSANPLAARLLAGGAVGAGAGALAGGEGNRMSGALLGAGLGAGAGAGVGAAMQKGVRGQLAGQARTGRALAGAEAAQAMRPGLRTGGQYARNAAFPTIGGAEKAMQAGAPGQNWLQKLKGSMGGGAVPPAASAPVAAAM